MGVIVKALSLGGVTIGSWFAWNRLLYKVCSALYLLSPSKFFLLGKVVYDPLILTLKRGSF